MRNLKNILYVAFLIPFILFTACKKVNKAPVVEIINPLEGETIMKGDIVSISAEAEDEDGSIAQSSIFIEGEQMKIVSASKIVYEWNTKDEELGEYVVSAYAIDDEDESSAVNILVMMDSPGGLNPDLTYGSVTDIDGNVYSTIEIGDQVWMAENLKVTKYADGSPISLVSDEATWKNLPSVVDAYCWYDNLSTYGDTAGALYTWAAAMNSAAGNDLVPSGIQGVCPDGWHVPSDAEWKTLELSLGMSQTEIDKHDWRGTDEGGQLKETGFSTWEESASAGDNTSGFTAVPGGFRSTKGLYYNFGKNAAFWSTTDESGTEKAWYRMLSYETRQLYRQYNDQKQGFSVRCVMD